MHIQMNIDFEVHIKVKDIMHVQQYAMRLNVNLEFGK